MGGFKKIYIFGDVALLSDWEGLKTEVKRGRGITTRRFPRGRNGHFFLSVLVQCSKSRHGTLGIFAFSMYNIS